LTDHHWRTLGTALKKIHSAKIPTQIKLLIPHETYSPQYRESVKSFQKVIENKIFDDPIATKLADFMKSKRDEITRIIDRAESLATLLQSQQLELVLCHADMHGGNVLISDTGEIFVVDWDYPMLSEKEHDLMFIGGRFFPNDFNQAWEPEQEEIPFYEGYGKTDINLAAMAYYRYDRIINDISAICEQLLLTNDGDADREPAFKSVTENFEPGSMIESADETYKRIKR
jgi:spectinomycin phosphotransferase